MEWYTGTTSENLSFSSSRWGYRRQSCLQAESLCSVADHFHSVLQVSHLEDAWWHDDRWFIDESDGCSEILDGRYDRCKEIIVTSVMRNKNSCSKSLLEHTAPEEELAMSRSCFSVFVRGPLAFLRHGILEVVLKSNQSFTNVWICLKYVCLVLDQIERVLSVQVKCENPTEVLEGFTTSKNMHIPLILPTSPTRMLMCCFCDAAQGARCSMIVAALRGYIQCRFLPLQQVFDFCR